MSDDELNEEEFEQAPEPGTPAPQQHFGTRRLGFLKGVLPSLLTVILAFLVSGVAIAAIGKNPVKVYRAIFDGTGLVWFGQVGSYSIRVPFGTAHVWFPWDTASVAAQNLQQTLLLTVPIALTAVAVALPFRAGMFNIGGQGQYFVGTYFAVWVGSSFPHLQPFVHVVFTITAATVAGAVYAGIAGILKATVGAHEVISTIMLNWIAIWVGSYLLGQGGPLQGPQPSIPVSAAVAEGAKLPVFWGPKLLQGLSVGIFIALAALIVYWLFINRSTLGFEVRAVGFNAEAARYGGISVSRNYFLAMALAGAFAGLGGACDILGWEYQIGELDVHANTVGFMGLAAALLGRNTALGVGASALLFGALLNGTSGRQLDPSIFRPDLAGNLTTIIQGLVVLFVGLNLAALPLWWRRRRGGSTA